MQKRGRFPFFGRANNSVAGFAVYFHRYLHSCFTECSTVPRLQGNSISAHVCSFVLDSGSSSHPRLVSIHQLIQFYRVFIISGHNFFLIVSYILRTLAVGFLNYTKLNFLKQSDPIYVFVIYKITVFVFFVVTLINLMATLLAVSVKIHEMHRAYTDKNSLDMDTINTLLAVFGTTTFRISLMSFFWEKLFTDDRNILCNHIPLE